MTKRGKRRSWSAGEKRMICAQTRVLGVSVSQVARRYDVNANQIFKREGIGLDRSTLADWVPFVNTYRTMCLAPKPEIRRVLEDVRQLKLAS